MVPPPPEHADMAEQTAIDGEAGLASNLKRKKPWRKPRIRRVMDGLPDIASGGPPEGTNPETQTYTHIS